MPTRLLLGRFRANARRQSPRAFLRGLRKSEHAQGIALIPDSLALLQKHISLHRRIAGNLRPFDGAVPPVVSKFRDANVPVEPASEFRCVRAYPQQLTACPRLRIGCHSLNSSYKTERNR